MRSASQRDRLFRPLVTLPPLFHSPSLKFTSAFYSSVVISGMIRHATIPSRPRLPLACQPQEGLPAGSCDKPFRSHAFGTSSRKPLVFCLFRTLPFSVHNIFPFKLFAFNPFRTLSEKQGGVYQLFPKRNSGYPFHESRITSHESRITPLESALTRHPPATHLESHSCAFLGRGRGGIVLVCPTKGFCLLFAARLTFTAAHQTAFSVKPPGIVDRFAVTQKDGEQK